jgi:hypothetical protein
MVSEPHEVSMTGPTDENDPMGRFHKITKPPLCSNCGLPRGKHTKATRLTIWYCRTGSTMYKPSR